MILLVIDVTKGKLIASFVTKLHFINNILSLPLWTVSGEMVNIRGLST